MKIIHVSWIGAALASALALGVHAADAPATSPARDLEPAVNTSATAQSLGAKPAAVEKASPGEKPVVAAKSAPVEKSAVTNKSAAAVTAAAAPAAAGARNGRVIDRLNLDATQVTGNSELPKVLYIVPWKRADLGDLNGRPMNSLLDEVLTPIDRDVFRRENRYYDALEAGQAAPQSQGTRDEK